MTNMTILMKHFNIMNYLKKKTLRTILTNEQLF